MRIGIVGGTFDPPHLGHLLLASDVYEALGLDRVVLVPAAVPPHKHGLPRTPAALRLEMLRAAVAGDPRFEVADLELRRAGPSYSVDTLRELRGRWPDAALFFVLGADQLRELPSWREPDEVARLATLTGVARDGQAPVAPGGYDVEVVPITRIDVSSSMIRDRAAAGRGVRYFVPPAVEAIIEREGLYG